MHPRLIGSLSVACLVAAGCFVPKDVRPTVDIGAVLATRFVHRGMTLVDRPVVTPSLQVGLPTNNGDLIGLTAEATMELRNDTGAAWFPDGHAGRFTQIEMIGDYSTKLGGVDLRGGIHSYNLPNGLEFPNGERGGTNELFVAASMEVLETTPYVAWNWDFDEVKASYYRAGLTEGFALAESLTLTLDGSVGYAASAQSAWMYGIADAGFADLRGEIVLAWAYDERTDVTIGVHGSTMLDSTIDDWLTQLGIDGDPLWFSAGIGWKF